jgi:hypothetical protein
MADTIKTGRYKEFETKYAPIFSQAMVEKGVDLDNLSEEKMTMFKDMFKQYVIAQMRRETNEPTKEEFESLDPVQQARVLSQKTDKPFGESYELVGGMPRGVSSSLYDSGSAERVGDFASDVLSGAGRSLRGGLSALTGGDPIESMARTPETSEGFLGKLASDPMTPVGVGMGKAFQGAQKGLKPLIQAGIGRGIAGGTAQSMLESGERGEFIPLDRMLGNLAMNTGGEILGGMAGSGGSALLKETGTLAGASSKGAREALEYAKLKPQRPFTMEGGFQKPFKSNQKELARVVGTEAEIGEELVDRVTNFERYLPETKQIRPIVEQLGDVDVLPVLEAIESVKIQGKILSPQALKVNKEIDDALTSILEQVPSGGKISAIDLYDLRKMLDESINFGQIGGNQPISKALEKGYKRARTHIKTELENLAEASGMPQYKKLMSSLSDKLNVRNKVARSLGKSSDVADERAEGVVSNLYGKNKTAKQQTMKEFDRITGGDIADKAYKSKLGAQIGVEEGGLPYSSDITTGKGGVLRATPIASPLIQADVVYPVADALKFLGESGTSSRLADLLTDRPRKALESYFNQEGEY